MKSSIANRTLRFLAWLVAAPAFCPSSLMACATCYGQSNSNLATGMTWGILALVAVIYLVLFSIVGFFAFLFYRARTVARAEAASGHASNRSEEVPVLADQTLTAEKESLCSKDC